MKKEALWYEKSEDKSVQCLLCPHNCKIPPGKRGICKVRYNDNGILYTLNYKKASSMAMDPVEKKPLYHFHRGKRILSVGTFGCNFRCDFCQNYEISQSDYYSNTLDIEKLISICKKDPNCIGIAYTYNEPTIWYEFVLECAKKFKAAGLANVLVSNGYINIPPLKELLPYIDAMNIDVKSMNKDFYKIICGGRPGPVMATVEKAVKNCHVEVTNLIIPTQNDSTEEMTKLSKWLASLNPNIPLHLSRYFPRYNMDLPPTDPALLLKLRNVASKYLNHVYIGNVPGIL
jgi:pyruvate formate lyase activating enzyme